MKQLVLFIMVLFIVLGECWGSKLEIYEEKNASQLILVQTNVIFRHGERTTYRFYPTDPNRNQTFYPIGLGGLTNHGKMGEFKLGQFLRQEYNNLLGSIYQEQDIDVRSTHTARTIMSALLVLAGLYPPAKEQIWNPNLNWQPIPLFSRVRQEEDLLHPEVCPRKLAIYNDLMNRPDVYEKFIKPYEQLYRFVTEKSGMSVRNPHDLLEFYFIVNTEADMDLTLPAWVHEIYPYKIYGPASLTYSYLNSNVELLRINAGYLMKKIIDDMHNMVQRNLNTKKMFLYSGHESTLGFLLHALNVLKPHVPAYGSAILIELFRDAQNEGYVQVRYRSSPTANEAVVFTIPGCTKMCPLKDFVQLQWWYLPFFSVQEACKLKE